MSWGQLGTFLLFEGVDLAVPSNTFISFDQDENNELAEKITK